jgi:hypothetical protein
MTPQSLPIFLDAAEPLADAETIELFSAIIDALDMRALLPTDTKVWSDVHDLLPYEIERISDHHGHD